MFIKVRDISDKLHLLNINHIIEVESFLIKNHKIGAKDLMGTKITSVGAMVSTTLVYDSFQEIEKLIKKAQSEG